MTSAVITTDGAAAGQVPQVALGQRLTAVAAALGVSPDPRAVEDHEAAGTLLDAVVASVRDRPTTARLWLLATAIGGEFPLAEDVLELERTLALSERSAAAALVLEHVLQTAARGSSFARTLQLVEDRPVVLADFSARHRLMTGIQRVVRSVVSAWFGRRDFALAGWTAHHTGFRALYADEVERLTQWSHATTDQRQRGESAALVEARAGGPATLLVPWGVTVVQTEVTPLEAAPRLVALARMSGNPVDVIGYDCIPVISADLGIEAEHSTFVAHLETVKYARTVVCISVEAHAEFSGFCDMIAVQGLRGPHIVTCELASVSDLPRPDPTSRGTAGPTGARPATADWSPDLPTVVCVGGISARKGQASVLEACEALWREGFEFGLRLLGGGGTGPAMLRDELQALARAGRKVDVWENLRDEDLADAIGAARFSVFAAVHEGYGLPVIESLALGVPVLAGPTGLLADPDRRAGALVTDVTDVGSLTDGMRSLLVDDDLHASLVRAAASRPARTWSEYADDLWALINS